VKNESRPRDGPDDGAQGRKRRRRPLVLALAAFALLTLCWVAICSVISLWGVALAPPTEPPKDGQSEKGSPAERSPGFLGLRVDGEAFNAVNMAPGDRVTGRFTLQNLGAEPVQVLVTAEVGSETGPCEVLQVSLVLTGQASGEASQVVYQGPVGELSREPELGIPLSAGGSEVLTSSVYFPVESGNEYQATQCLVDLVFEGRGTSVG